MTILTYFIKNMCTVTINLIKYIHIMDNILQYEYKYKLWWFSSFCSVPYTSHICCYPCSCTFTIVLSLAVIDERQWAIRFQPHMNPMTVVNKTNYNKLMFTCRHWWRYHYWEKSDVKVLRQRDQYHTISISNK